jgi:hypothetical protein
MHSKIKNISFMRKVSSSIKRSRILLLIIITVGLLITSCDSLGVKPKSIITNDDVFSNSSGVEAYLVRLYSELPIADFKYNHRNGFHDWWIFVSAADNTGEALSRDATSVTNMNGYWEDGFHLIRLINQFLEELPKYKSNFNQSQLDKWEGAAHFMRAFTYFTMVKRYGGIPIVTKVLQYPGTSIKDLQLPRSSAADVYKLINKDLDFAATHLPSANDKGKVNKYAAYAFKSRVDLFAGSIATYNKTKLVDDNGDRLCGLPANSATSYFKKSYNAAVKLQNHYHLYMKNWEANDSKAQEENYRELFMTDNSPENIWVKYYKRPDSFHGYDAYNVPLQARGSAGYSSGLCPTLNFVNLFSGLPRNKDGTLKLVDQKGNYILYPKMGSFFKNAEPRLMATVITPGATFNGMKISVRRGIYTGSVKNDIPKLIPKDSKDSYPTKNIVQSGNQSQTPYTLPNGDKMNPAGKSGRFTAFGFQTPTGFYVRKYLTRNLPPDEVLEQHSTQHWILIRYAEVLLNRAESAYQLYLAGNTGIDYRMDAFKDINKIRKRAGAPLLKKETNLNIQIIRKERQKELAFEHRYWWTLIRTRTASKVMDNTIFKILNPFYVAKAGEYFYDARYDERNSKFTFDPKWYYLEIPSSAIDQNKNLIQNPGY